MVPNQLKQATTMLGGSKQMSSIMANGRSEQETNKATGSFPHSIIRVKEKLTKHQRVKEYTRKISQCFIVLFNGGAIIL